MFRAFGKLAPKGKAILALKTRRPPASEARSPQAVSTPAIHRLGEEAGFDETRVAPAQAPALLEHYRGWIRRGFAGRMDYLSRQVEARSDLKHAFPWARTIIMNASVYDRPHPYSTEAPEDHAWISRYAWGDDYHKSVRSRLERLRASLKREFPGVETRAFVDTGPIAEKAYAVAAGLGAYGKNSCVLNPKLGSWFFIGVLITDLDIAPDPPVADLCGSCRACLDACPTNAFPAPYVLDATRCISYLTIEVKGSIDPDLRAPMGRQIYGCDICQDVCPWNRKRRVFAGEDCEPRPGLLAPAFDEFVGLDVEGFRARFRGSSMRRTKRQGLLRNLAVAIGNAGEARHRPLLEGLARDEDPVVAEHARWGLERLEARLDPQGLPPGRSGIRPE